MEGSVVEEVDLTDEVSSSGKVDPVPILIITPEVFNSTFPRRR